MATGISDLFRFDFKPKIPTRATRKNVPEILFSLRRFDPLDAFSFDRKVEVISDILNSTSD